MQNFNENNVPLLTRQCSCERPNFAAKNRERREWMKTHQIEKRPVVASGLKRRTPKGDMTNKEYNAHIARQWGYVIPYWCEQELKNYKVNDFHRFGSWAPYKLDWYTCDGYLEGTINNYHQVPPGIYIKQMCESEKNAVAFRYMPTYGGGYRGGPRVSVQPDETQWWRIFFVTKRTITLKWITNEWYALTDEFVEKKCGGPVRGVIRKMMKSAMRFERMFEICKHIVDEDTLWLDEEIQIRKELVHMRDMERTSGRWTYENGRVDLCKFEDCCVYTSCSCGMCIEHCIMGATCSLPRNLVEESRKERNFVAEIYHRPGTGRRQHRLEKLRRMKAIIPGGDAHALFFPDSFEHNININFPFLDPFVEGLKEFDGSIPWKRILKDFAFMCAQMYVGKTKETALVSVVHFITQLPLSEKLASDLLHRIAALFQTNAQSVAAEGLFVPVLTMFGVVVSTLGLKQIPSDKSITDFILRLSKIGACITSLEKIRDYIQPAAEAVIDYIRVNFFGYSSTNLNAWKSYDEFCNEIQELNNSGFEERLKTEKDLVIKIDDLLLKGDILMKTLDQLRVPAIQRSRFNAGYAWLGRMRSEAAYCSAGKHIPRVPPVIFHIIGKTGVGKSEATTLLNARLLTALGHTDPSDLYTKIYYRDVGQERFDGFNSAVEGVVVDDFGSRVDTPQAPSSEPFEVIRMQNSAVWQLPMASLAEKGSTFFRAKFVIWTSNRATYKFESITNPEAVLRRVTCKFSQYPRPEFALQKMIGDELVTVLDHVKVAEAARTNPEVYDDVWLFDLVDPMENAVPSDVANGGMRVIRQGLSFDEMATICEEALLQAQKLGNKKLDHTKKYFEKCVNKRGHAQGCNWFNWFSRSKEEMYPPDEDMEFEHFTLSDYLNGRFEGNDISPSRRTMDDFPEVENSQWKDFYGQMCFEFRKATSLGLKKTQERFLRAVLQAYAQVETERMNGALTTEQEMDIFNRVMFSFNIPRNWCTKCTEHDQNSWWKKYFEMKTKMYRKVLSWLSKIPESWKPVLNVAYEVASQALMTFLFTLGILVVGSLIHQFFMWLFPSLDPERQKLLKVYEDALFEMKFHENIPVELEITLSDLEAQLGFTKTDRAKLDMKASERYGKALNNIRKRDAESAESHQNITKGAIRKNVESHQNTTPGKSKQNVESFQNKTTGVVRRNVEAGVAEATSDQNAAEVAFKVKRNVYGIEVKIGNEWNFVGNLVFVIGKIAITNKHIMNIIRGREFRLFNSSCSRGVVISQQQSERLNISEISEGIHSKKDVVMVEMPRHMLVHADIRHFFMKREDFSRHAQPEVVCVLGFGSDLGFQHRFTDKCQAIDRVDFELREVSSQVSLVRDWYRYGIHSRPGDCGSVAVAYDPSISRKIMGLHMAGYDSEGYFGIAVAVHQELMEALKKQLVLENAESDLNGEFAHEGERVDHSFGDFVNYGKAMSTGNSATTIIRPGPIHGLLAEPKTKPAHLRPYYKDGELVDPLEKARQKADTPNIPVDAVTLRQCSKHYRQLLLDLKRDNRDDRVLSWEEAIKGTEDHFYSSIKRNTSPGYGWKSKGTGKEPWLGTNEDFITDHPDVVAKRDEMMQRLQEGKRASAVFVDTLKDERRPIDKVEEGKTRLFAAGEMVFSIIFRQYFAGFNAHIMRNCVTAESTVGINPFGEMWNLLANRLSELGSYVVAGDFSNYDGTLCSAILWECLDVVEAFYQQATDEERQIRRGLFCELVNSVHATTPFNGTQYGSESFLYQWSHSQPSGNPMTVILNSVYHSIAARYVFKLCARKYCPEKVSLDNWDRYVRHANYGDDDLYNIHPEIIDWFNQLTMTEGFLHLGMVYTDEAKTGNLVRARTLEEVAFLKRGFRWDEKQCRWRCPHSLDVILEMAMWIKRGADKYALTAEVLEEAVHELAQHPKIVFDQLIPLFQSARAKIVRYWPCTLLSYEEYEEIDLARMGMLITPDVRAQKFIDQLFD